MCFNFFCLFLLFLSLFFRCRRRPHFLLSFFLYSSLSLRKSFNSNSNSIQEARVYDDQEKLGIKRRLSLQRGTTVEGERENGDNDDDDDDNDDDQREDDDLNGVRSDDIFYASWLRRGDKSSDMPVPFVL